MLFPRLGTQLVRVPLLRDVLDDRWEFRQGISLILVGIAAEVSMNPGATELTRTPLGPTSFDNPLL